MRATFILSGPSISRRGSLGEMDMRDIAPTLAKILRWPRFVRQDLRYLR